MKKVLLLCLLAGSVYGEPSSTVRFLMGEPLTLWDWGLIKTDKMLEDRFADRPWSLSLRYSWDRNELMVAGIHAWGDDPPSTLAAAKALCRRTISQIREALGVNSTSGKGYGEDGLPLFYTHFLHEGFSSPGEPDDLGASLGYMTKIRVVTRTKGGVSVVADAPLLGTDIFFKE